MTQQITMYILISILNKILQIPIVCANPVYTCKVTKPITQINKALNAKIDHGPHDA